MSYAPIALFVYARPLHTRQTLEALRRCALAPQSDLFIFSDAPRSPKLVPAVREVRDIIRGVTGFCSITIVEREHNMGLAASIVDGVTRLCRERGRAIVVEDDIVAAPEFLRFMNDALDAYAEESRVMHVSGYMFPVAGPEGLPETFFFRAPSCWGWATWQRAWAQFEPDSHRLVRAIEARDRAYEFDLCGAAGYMKMLRAQAAGRLDSWAVRWYASIFLNGGLCLHPAHSLTQNIGHDGTGVHCSPSDRYGVTLTEALPAVIRQRTIEESPAALEAIRQFNLGLQRPLYARAVAGLGWRLRKFLGLLPS